jgi:porin
LAVLALGFCWVFPSFAEEEAGAPAGILPIPDYKSDIWNRAYLTGDWGGKRTEWANKGFQFDVDSFQWFDNVTDGGKSSNTKWGGNLTYNIEWDLMRAGLVPGALIQIRAESRYGNSAIFDTGQIQPTNSGSLSPTNYSEFDDGYDLALTQFSYLQMLSPHFGMIAGKLDLYGDGDLNEFTSGRGRTGFSIWSIGFPTGALFVPATTFGVGAVYLPSEYLTISSIVLNGVECTSGNCLDNLYDENGGVSATSVNWQYNLGGKPGGISGTYLYFFDADFTELGTVLPVPTEGLVGSTKSSTWEVAASFWQYLSVQEPHEGPVHLNNREPDLPGWGIFARVGVNDDTVNPWEDVVSFGLGGRGVIPNRPNDTFGVGYFFASLSDERTITDDFEDPEGAEAFYRLAITPAVKFSLNLKYIGGSEPGVDDATMLSGYLQIIF